MTEEKHMVRGKVYVLGDNIDTDQIIPAKYLNLVPTIQEEYEKLGSHAFAGLPEGYPEFVPEGEMKSPFTIVVAGRNFGCGSSREHAPICLGAAGIKAVVAESYARIFFRNAISTGEVYPLETYARLCEAFEHGSEAAIDIDGSCITNPATGDIFDLTPLGAVAPVVDAGGIFGYARATGMIGRK